MSNAPLNLISQFYITLDGADAPAAMMQDLERALVETSMHMPAMAELTLYDPDLKWVDSPTLEPGKGIKIKAKAGTETAEIFDGEIVEVEPEFSEGNVRLLVRAFDRMHRLARGQHTRTFLNVTDGDVIKKLAQEAGLTSQVDQTSEVHPYLMQANETNLAFIERRAARLGYVLSTKNEKLRCVAPETASSTSDLKWNENLLSFRPRLSTVGQVNKVTARGWDPKQKREVVGQATSPAHTPKVGVSQTGGAMSQQAYSLEAEMLAADGTLRTQSEAEKLAQALLNDRAGRFIQAEGLCVGMPKLIAGAAVKVSGVGTRFSGTYFVTAARHEYNLVHGYLTSFSVSGMQPQSIVASLAPRPAAPPVAGLVVGVVTDNSDPENQGRVKVKLPWLTSDHTTDWARVVSAGAGKERGVLMIPEVNDEVLVGFEHGNINVPYVLGGLWNGKDAMPIAQATAVASGKVMQRIIKTRVGHQILIDDADDGGGITIKDKKGNTIFIDAKNDELTITSLGKMKLDAGGDFTLDVKGKFTVSSTGDATIDSKGRLSLKAPSGAALETNGSLDLSGSNVTTKANANLTIQANAMLDVKTSAILNIQGSLVKIN